MGWVRYSTATQSLSGDMVLIVEGEELTVPMTLESSTLVELID